MINKRITQEPQIPRLQISMGLLSLAFAFMGTLALRNVATQCSGRRK